MPRCSLSSGGLFVPLLAATLLAGGVAGCATSVNDAIDGLTPGDDGTGPASVANDAGKHDGGSYYGQPDTGSTPVGDGDAGSSVVPDTGTVAPTDSGSAGVDAGTVATDSGTVVVDSGSVAPTCAPASVAGLTTTYHGPAGSSGDCSTSEIDQFYTACLDPVNSSQTACTKLQNGSAGLFCIPCLVTTSTSSTWGPLVQYPDKTVSLNTGGCYASGGASQCGHSSQYVLECDRAACAACSTSNGDFDACAAAAEAGGCSQYVQSESTQCAPYAASGCALGATFEASYKSIARVMCGP